MRSPGKLGSDLKMTKCRLISSKVLRVVFMAILVLIVGLICYIERVECVIHQSSSSMGEQNSLMNIDNGNSQDSPSAVRGGGLYSTIVDGVDGNNGFMGWTRGTYANNNNKRARKMSAFMPMRGRKDGRDEPDLATMSALNRGSSSLDNPMSDSNRGDSDSIHDWITASTVGPLLWASNTSPMQSMGQQQHYIGTPVPLQFANQVAANHRMQQQRISPSTDTDGSAASSAGDSPMSGPLSLAPGAFEQANVVPGSSAGVMQAKLRRAFHPMRGKKWTGSDSGMASIDDIAAEIALARNGFDM